MARRFGQQQQHQHQQQLSQQTAPVLGGGQRAVSGGHHNHHHHHHSNHHHNHSSSSSLQHRASAMASGGSGSGGGGGGGGGLASSTSSGRFRINAVRHTVTIDRSHVEQTWEKLRTAVVQILHREESELSFEELYRHAYNLCLHKHGEMLYEGLISVLTEHLSLLAGRVEAAVHNSFLDCLRRTWEQYTTAMLMIRDILLFMDRNYVPAENLKPVYDLGLTKFREEVILRPKVSSFLRQTLLELVALDRSGEPIDRQALKAACTMLVELGVETGKQLYEAEFEKHFLQQAELFFAQESIRYLADEDASSYLRQVQLRLDEELERVRHCLDAESTSGKIEKVIETAMLLNHMQEILAMENTGIAHMLENKKTDDLRLVFKLFARVPGGHEAVGAAVRGHLEAKGRALNEEEARSEGNKTCISYVQSILDLRADYNDILELAFAGDQHFQHVMNEAFATFMDENPKTPEYLSLFLDDLLRRKVKEVFENEQEKLLDSAMGLFRYVREKDVFERYYKGHLAKRLLHGKVASEEAEASIIARLKRDCGCDFTHKLEGMFKDVRVSSDLQASFKDHLEASKQTTPFDFSGVRVLTFTFWPTASQTAKLPDLLQGACNVFETFYNSKYNGRKLTWQVNLGNAELTCQFGEKSHVLACSTFQMLVLLQFNKCAAGASLPFKDLEKETGLAEAELKRTLQSLACGKVRLLTKTPKGRDIGDEDTFCVNEGFSSKMYRIKIPQIASVRETSAQREVTRTKVEDDRKHLIEACVVRIMKARKELHHNHLLVEVTQQLSSRFKVNPTLVKKRIENLIERDFLERSADNRKVYKYLA